MRGFRNECSECRKPISQPRTGRTRVTCCNECNAARGRRLKRLKRHAAAQNLSAAEKAYLEEFRREMVAPQPKRGAP